MTKYFEVLTINVQTSFDEWCFCDIIPTQSQYTFDITYKKKPLLKKSEKKY